MQEKYLVEKIKFLTEWFKLLFTLFILLSGGLAALFATGTFLNNTFDLNLLKGGLLFAFTLILFITFLIKRINFYINKLKEL